MATLTEDRTMQQTTVDREAELHNAQIAERYKRLQNAEEKQFAEASDLTARENYAVRASVLAPERPAEYAPATQQQPQVTEFVREKIDSPVFTTEKFERAEIATQGTPAAAQVPAIAPVQAVAPTTAIVTETQYSLSRMAKTVMAAFAAVVVLMLTLICVNTQILNRQSVRIRNLEQQREELIERNEEIRERIEIAQSEETIREYAISQGMIAGE